MPEIPQGLQQKLEYPVSHLELSVRASMCLAAAEIHTVGDLVKCSEADLLKLRNFGRSTLKEIVELLADWDLKLGM